MALKAFLVAAAVAAIIIGFALPAPHAGRSNARSQIPTMDLRQ